MGTNKDLAQVELPIDPIRIGDVFKDIPPVNFPVVDPETGRIRPAPSSESRI
jgi:hypothetical protein